MMLLKHKEKEVFQSFGELLEYPKDNLHDWAKRCKELCNEVNNEAGNMLGEFCVFLENNPIGHVEEVYTNTFEMNTSCSPYIGYHLFGETHKRSIFMLELKERYRPYNFITPPNELPDHAGLILKFLHVCDNEELTNEIINEALLPVLDKIQNNATETYKNVLSSLILILKTYTSGKGCN